MTDHESSTLQSTAEETTRLPIEKVETPPKSPVESLPASKSVSIVGETPKSNLAEAPPLNKEEEGETGKLLGAALSVTITHNPVPGEERKEIGFAKQKIDVKLFVNHIPKNWEDQDVIRFFGERASILEGSVLKDKLNGEHKGCAFVRVSSLKDAEEIIENMHNIHRLGGASQPLHIKYADGELDKLGLVAADGTPYQKLFIANIPKSASESEICKVFEAYGEVKEIIQLKEADNMTFKGSILLRYYSLESALSAIHALNNKYIMVKGEKTLEVRFADPKSKAGAPTISGATRQLPLGYTVVGSTQQGYNYQGLGLQKNAMSTNAMGTNAMGTNAMGGTNAMNTPQPSNYNNQAVPQAVSQGYYPQNNNSQGITPTLNNPGPSCNIMSTPSPSPQTPGVTFIEFMTGEGRCYYYNTVSGVTQWEKPGVENTIIQNNVQNLGGVGNQQYYQGGGAVTAVTGGINPLNPYIKSTGGTPQIMGGGGRGFGGLGMGQGQGAQGAVGVGRGMGDQAANYGLMAAGGQGYRQGPPGGNLFIFHLPSEWGEQDLLTHFAQYGHIVSARIMTDRATGRSRGFGFISYDNNTSAQQAMALMNGFSVLGKRLKVQLKKGDGGPDHAIRPDMQ